MENQNNISKYVGSGIIMLLIGAIIGIVVDPYLPGSLSNSKKGYQTGFLAAQKLVQNSSLGSFFHTPATITALEGTVTSVNGGSFTIHTSSLNPFDSALLADRIVIITASTTIYSEKPADPQVYQTALQAYAKAVATNPKATPPSSTITTPLNFSNIAKGDSVGITAGGDIKSAKQFTAQSIQVFPKPVLTSK